MPIPSLSFTKCSDGFVHVLRECDDGLADLPVCGAETESVTLPEDKDEMCPECERAVVGWVEGRKAGGGA